MGYKLKISRFFILISLSVLMISCARLSNQIVVEKSDIKYYKSKNANNKIEGDRFKYTFWYDDNKWKHVNNNSNLYIVFKNALSGRAEVNHIFLDSDSDVYVMIMNETNISSSYEDILKHSISLFNGKQFKLLESEYRNVNNNDILYLHYLTTENAKRLELISYILSNNCGQVTVTIATAQFLFKEFQNDIYELINGLDYTFN